jgi:translation elongation factor EF-1beta
MAQFGDANTPAGLKKLNDYLESRTYLEGYQASQTDLAVLAVVGTQPNAKSYPHASRWFRHISSFSDVARANLPGSAPKLSKTEEKAAPAAEKTQEKAPEKGKNEGKGKGGKAEAKSEAPAKASPGLAPAKSPKQAPAKSPSQGPAKSPAKSPASAPAAKAPPADDDFDLFGEEEEDPEAEKRRSEALRASLAKNAEKGLIAKTSLLLDFKPWDDSTDMKKMEELVRSLQMDGLTWGASKLVPVAFGIKKLQIMATVVDDKVSVDDIENYVTENGEEYVQSMDVAAMNKI